MLDIKQAMQNVFLQVDVFAANDRIVEQSLEVINDNHGQQVLTFRHDVNHAVYYHSGVIMPYKMLTMGDKLKKAADLDLLKAFKEVGNAYIRQVNAATVARIEDEAMSGIFGSVIDEDPLNSEYRGWNS